MYKTTTIRKIIFHFSPVSLHAHFNTTQQSHIKVRSVVVLELSTISHDLHQQMELAHDLNF